MAKTARKQRETIEAAIAARRCPICKIWFMTTTQRDNHLQKKHDGEIVK